MQTSDAVAALGALGVEGGSAVWSSNTVAILGVLGVEAGGAVATSDTVATLGVLGVEVGSADGTSDPVATVGALGVEAGGAGGVRLELGAEGAGAGAAKAWARMAVGPNVEASLPSNTVADDSSASDGGTTGSGMWAEGRACTCAFAIADRYVAWIPTCANVWLHI